MVMPQFLDAFVLFASMMQRYEFFPKPPNLSLIIFEKNAKYSNIHLFKYDIYVFENALYIIIELLYILIYNNLIYILCTYLKIPPV